VVREQLVQIFGYLLFDVSHLSFGRGDSSILKVLYFVYYEFVVGLFLIWISL